MWFKNLLIYRFTAPVHISAESLESALQQKVARACGSQEVTTYGFIPPIGKREQAPLTHSSQHFVLFAACKEERLLPSTVIREALGEKIEEIETQQMRKVYRKERNQLREDIIQTLLPRAFIRRQTTRAAIDLKQGLILVDSSAPRKAEELLSLLRDVLGSLPVRPLMVRQAPIATLTHWLKTQHASAGFTVLDECELRDTHEDGGIVRCKRQDLSSEEIQTHLSAGKVVVRLALDWQERLSFLLDDKLTLRRLRFGDVLHEQISQESGDDALAEQDATFALMMLTFAEFLPMLIEALGGEESGHN